jgi:flagellar motility protein MotE (MotC chaperone)
MKKRIRLLPVVIFAATLALTLKVGAIWQGTNVVVATATAADSKSETEKTAKPEGAKHESEPGKGAEKDETSHAKKETGQIGDEFDPTSVTEAEFQVLQRLAQRRAELDKLRRDLTLKENLLQATEKRLNDKLAELNGLKDTIEGLLKKHDEEQEKKLKSLVKIYEKMKPKNAARIFEQLEMSILLDVVERMREAKTAPIFAAMDPTKAKAATARLAERRQLPVPSMVTEGG